MPVKHLSLRLQSPSFRKCKKVLLKMYLWKYRVKLVSQCCVIYMKADIIPAFQQRRVLDCIKGDNLIRLH